MLSSKSETFNETFLRIRVDKIALESFKAGLMKTRRGFTPTQLFSLKHCLA